jgi:hypothetical protein
MVPRRISVSRNAPRGAIARYNRLPPFEYLSTEFGWYLSMTQINLHYQHVWSKQYSSTQLVRIRFGSRLALPKPTGNSDVLTRALSNDSNRYYVVGAPLKALSVANQMRYPVKGFDGPVLRLMQICAPHAPSTLESGRFHTAPHYS